jgi:hypothetical protein
LDAALAIVDEMERSDEIALHEDLIGRLIEISGEHRTR